jgi:hypothetical protein
VVIANRVAVSMATAAAGRDREEVFKPEIS